MSEELKDIFDVFDAIDEASSEGLEAMLQKIVEDASGTDRYSTVAEVKILIERVKLDIPVDAEIRDILQDMNHDQLKQLQAAEKMYRTEAGEQYEKDNNFTQAAYEYLKANDTSKAIEMFIRDGSPKSILDAESAAIGDGDYKTALGLRTERGYIRRAFRILEYMRSREKLKKDDMQEWRERIIKDAYGPVVEIIKADIRNLSCEEPEPDGETIAQLIKYKKDVLYNHAAETDKYIEESIECAMNSDDSKIIEIGLESNEYRACNKEDKDGTFKDTEMFLKGRLADDCDRYVQYFLKRYEDKAENGQYCVDLRIKAIELLKHHKRYDKALELAEEYLSSDSRIIPEILEESGRFSELALHYKEHHNPVKYVFALAKAGKMA